MPGLFIDVKVSGAHAKDAALAKKLEEACPVDIFAASSASFAIDWSTSTSMKTASSFVSLMPPASP